MQSRGAGSGGYHSSRFSPWEANPIGVSQVQAWTFDPRPRGLGAENRLDRQGSLRSRLGGQRGVLLSADSGGSTRASPCGREGAPHGSGQAHGRTARGIAAGCGRAGGQRPVHGAAAAAGAAGAADGPGPGCRSAGSR